MAVEDKMVASSDCGSEETSSNLVYRPIIISLEDILAGKSLDEILLEQEQKEEK